MRMWGVKPELMCNTHLLGEHVEMHMFIGTIRKAISIKGYVEKGLVNPAKIIERHNELAKEMINRGMSHNSPLNYYGDLPFYLLDVEKSYRDLLDRCPRCRERRVR